MSFEPDDPFPRVELPYAQAQLHAERVDHWLGLDTRACEARIEPIAGQQLWTELPVRALLTPYTELRAMLERLAPARGQTVVDLGAAYGRLGFVMARHSPEARFVGYELAEERVLEGRSALARFGARNAALIAADLSATGFAPEPADFYFVYDYGTRAAIDKTLEDLRTIARAREIIVIGRGRASRDAIERGHPWLAGVHAPQHAGHWTLYRS
jgi:hypothetical protein